MKFQNSILHLYVKVVGKFSLHHNSYKIDQNEFIFHTIQIVRQLEYQNEEISIQNSVWLKL